MDRSLTWLSVLTGGLIIVVRYFDFLCADGCEYAVIPLPLALESLNLPQSIRDGMRWKTSAYILFLGFNSSFSISSLHFPQYEGNHIYFADSNLSIFSKFYKQEVLVFLIWGMEFLRHYQVSNLILNFCGLHPFRWTLLKVTFVGWFGSKSCSYRPIFQVRSTKSHPFHLYVQTPDLYSVLIVSEEKRNIYLNSFIIPFLFSIIFF